MEQLIQSLSSRLALRRQNQSGINMVDLMMWLVIAALLLAAAIQGIGYYQQAAQLYTLKNDVMGAAQQATSVAATAGEVITEPLVAAGVAQTNKSADVVLQSGYTPLNKPMIRGTHPTLPTREVIYLFDGYANLAAGIHVVTNGVVEMEDKDGNVVSPPSGGTTPDTGGGDGDGSGDSGSTPTPSPSASATPSTPPVPTAQPEPTPPADVNATNMTVAAFSYSPHDSMFDNRNIKTGHTNTPIAFRIVGATSVSGYTLEWTGGGKVNASVTGSSPANIGTQYGWTAILTPNEGGFIAGITSITAKVTNNSSGAISYKTWTIGVSEGDITTASAYAPMDGMYGDRSIKSGLADVPIHFAIRNYADATKYTVAWSGGENINVTSITGYTARISNEQRWYTEVVPAAGGFTAGTGTITATITASTGKVTKKTWTITVTEGDPTRASAYTPLDNMYGNQSIKSGQADVNFVFAMGHYADEADYTVTWSGGDNINAAPITGSTTRLGNEQRWYATVEAKSGTTGFIPGTGTITATITTKSGKVTKKDWTLTVTEGSPAVASGYSPYDSMFNDQTLAVGSTTDKAIAFAIRNYPDASDYTITWSGGEGLNIASLSKSQTSVGSELVTFATIKAGTGGFTAGTGVITATITTKGGKVTTETWNITVK